MRTIFLSFGLLVMICIPFHSHAQDDLDFQKLLKEVDTSATSIQEPSKGDADHPVFENNTFNVCFLLK